MMLKNLCGRRKWRKKTQQSWSVYVFPLSNFSGFSDAITHCHYCLFSFISFTQKFLLQLRRCF